MITTILAVALAVIFLLWLVVSSRAMSGARKLGQENRRFLHRIHRLALQSAESEPFARIILDECNRHAEKLDTIVESEARGKTTR